MVDVTDSKSVGGDTVWVRVPPPAPEKGKSCSDFPFSGAAPLARMDPLRSNAKEDSRPLSRSSHVDLKVGSDLNCLGAPERGHPKGCPLSGIAPLARMDPHRSLCRVLTKIPRPITLLFFTLCFFLQRHLRSGRGDAGVDAPLAVLFISRPGEATCAVAIRHNIWYYLFYGCTLSCENFALSFRQNRLDRMCVNDQSL